MNRRFLLSRIVWLSLPALALLARPSRVAAATSALIVDVDKPGPAIPPLFYGLMTEEVNHAYDGGLYAELIQNRIFADDVDNPAHWSPFQFGTARATLTLTHDHPVNPGALATSVRIDVSAPDATGLAGVANDGFWGIPVWPHTKYHASFYARASAGFKGSLSVGIVKAQTPDALATASVASIGADWKKYEVDLTTADVPVSTDNRFAITTASPGSVFLSLVSLFPPTFHDRPNGLRIDLMQKMLDLHPKFLRFPGGNYLEGNTYDQRFDWKKTLGPLEDRPGHRGPWGYRSSDGMGLLEFFQWCQDLGAEPILAVYGGYSLQQHHLDAGPALVPCVQDALDEIEYATGDASTPWGKKRIDAGHAAPFSLRFVEIGNEDWFDKSGSYDARFAQIYDAIKAKYPHIECIATMPVRSRKPDWVDDHAYLSHADMERAVHRYDDYDAKKPKVFFGEWATLEGNPTPTWRAAVADAAWLTGLQNDSRVVGMNCYAPLLVNVNPKAAQWSTNLIGYDAARSFGSASYVAQCLFSRAWGDQTLPAHLTEPVGEPVPPTGSIGLGLWHTAAEFKDIRLVEGNETKFQSDFSRKLTGWKPILAGDGWSATGASLRHDAASPESRIVLEDDPRRTDYTVTLKARQLSGDEGFLIMFHVADRDNFTWLNLGGWHNTRSAIEQSIDGKKTTIGRADTFTIERGRWYDVRIDITHSEIRGFVDGKEIIHATEQPVSPGGQFFVAASRDTTSGDVILKIVNTRSTPTPIEIDLRGIHQVEPTATWDAIWAQADDVNSLDEPDQVKVRKLIIPNVTPKFTQTFLPLSVNVIRLKIQ